MSPKLLFCTTMPITHILTEKKKLILRLIYLLFKTLYSSSFQYQLVQIGFPFINWMAIILNCNNISFVRFQCIHACWKSPLRSSMASSVMLNSGRRLEDVSVSGKCFSWSRGNIVSDCTWGHFECNIPSCIPVPSSDGWQKRGQTKWAYPTGVSVWNIRQR